MIEIIKLLSGDIPGGAILLLVAIIFINFAFSFLKRSGLLKPNGLKLKWISANLIILLLYAMLWSYNKPYFMPQRIVILPSKVENEAYFSSQKAIYLPQLMQNNASTLKGRYQVHKWQWMHKTLQPLNINKHAVWSRLAKELGPEYIIESFFKDNNTLNISIFKPGLKEPTQFDVSYPLTNADLEKVLMEVGTGVKSGLTISSGPDMRWQQAEFNWAQHRYERVLKNVEHDTTLDARLIKAKTHVLQGLALKKSEIKKIHQNEGNPHFNHAKKILYPITRKDKENELVNRLLARIFLREEDYARAEIFLKKNYIDAPYDAEIHYLLSKLYPERLEELGFTSTKKILIRTVRLDPGNSKAVLDLAHEYFVTGTGARETSGAISAIETAQNFLKLNPDKPEVLNTLGGLYIKSEYYAEADSIYSRLARLYPYDSNMLYNKGIVQYSQSNYNAALNLFRQAIAMDENLDAYLYAGMTAQLMGDSTLALSYYRERVKRKTGDDDKYAKEAMRGIRNILQ